MGGRGDAPEGTLAALSALVESRREERPDGSYTTRLFDAGLDAIGAKVLEEAREAVEAAAESGAAGREHLTREAADLLYHLLVLLAARDVPFADVEAELGRRAGTSGLDEKASRGLDEKAARGEG